MSGLLGVYKALPWIGFFNPTGRRSAVRRRSGRPMSLLATYVRQAQERHNDVRKAYCDALSAIEDVAAGLSDESLRDTFMNSAHV
jgi:hypothetical protein